MNRIAKLFIINILIVSVLSSFAICANSNNTGIMPRERYLELADQYAKEHEIDKLNQLMADMLGKYPDDPDALNHKGVLLMFSGKFDEAEQTIRYAIEKNPGYDKLDELYLTLGDIFNLKTSFDDAEIYFKKAIEINPNSRAHANLFLVYVRQAKYKDAVQEHELFLKGRKGDDYLFMRLGDAYYELREYKAAAISYQKSIDLGGAQHDIYKLTGLAKSYEALGDYYHANLAYEELYRWHKYTARARNEYKRFKRKLEEIEKGKN